MFRTLHIFDLFHHGRAACTARAEAFIPIRTFAPQVIVEAEDRPELPRHWQELRMIWTKNPEDSHRLQIAWSCNQPEIPKVIPMGKLRYTPQTRWKEVCSRTGHTPFSYHTRGGMRAAIHNPFILQMFNWLLLAIPEMRFKENMHPRQSRRVTNLRQALCAAVVCLVLLPIAKAQTSPTPTPPGEDLPSADAVSDPESMFPHFKSGRFWISGQMNFIFQVHPDFHAPYSGPNSLSPRYEKATSRVLTLYTGVRLNDSTEILVDIEEAGGAALTTGLGLAGNTDLDIVRNPLLSKAPYVGRAMIHKVFALSKDKVENQRGFLNLFDELPRRRLEIRFGKFSMPDFLDVNSIGSDTHFQFNNWTIDNNGAWDYAADTRGYTIGFLADYEDRNWGFRFAEGLLPKVANGIDLVWRPWEAHAENWEYELRHGLLPKKVGAIRLLAFMNHANMGVYREAVAQFVKGQVATPDITNHPWHITRKYGFGVNLEQNLTTNLSAFARWGWDDGKTESFAYTEVDSNIAVGARLYGAQWHRNKDRAGLAFVSNGIKKDHQVYLADGGLGFLLGDGKLTYGRENIVESYYTAHIWRGIYLSPGVQYVVNPGYNRDRGPVVVPTLRGHVEF